MSALLLALLEKLILSPVVQDEAWAIIKPHLEAGTTPTTADINKANAAADAAHAAATA